ncbi:MAG: T9SS type A sorting domain-containing protein [Algibacter sp.]
MKRHILLLVILIISFNAVSAQTIFGWETATDNGAIITETIDGITVELSGDTDLEILTNNPTGFGGTTANVALTQNIITSVTFTFDQPVVVNSIIPIDAAGDTVDYIFTPTGGSNVPITASLVQGESPTINLNWVNVTSFTVTSTGAGFGFDNLSVDTGTNGQTFFEWETAVNNGGTITETINDIEVTVSGDSSYALIDYAGDSSTSGNVVLSNANRTSITFTFDQAVAVNSILALEGRSTNIDYTFTPTGGANAPVVASLISGATAVKLNWTNVTSFTVTSTGGQFGFDNLSVFGMASITLFEWETAVPYFDENGKGTYVDETIDGISVTVTTTGVNKNGIADSVLLVGQDWTFGSSTGNVVWRSASTIEQVTVTFNQPVTVNSLLPLEWNRFDLDFIFTPTGGNNSPVIISLIAGEAPTVNLNWVGVTSFTIKGSGGPVDGKSSIMIDDLSVNALIPLGFNNEYRPQKMTMYPNPVENTLYIKNVSDLIVVKVYNLLRQQVLQSNANSIDVSELSHGVYLLQIQTGKGMETRRIVKK